MTLLDVELRPEDFLPESRAISNSEAISFLTCKRQYNFAFVDNLAPKHEGRQLTRGTMGHKWMQVYIEARLAGASHEEAMQAASSYLTTCIQEGAPIDIVMEVQMLNERYMRVHQGWPDWQLLGTEQRLDLKISDSLTLPIRYDLYVMHKPTGRRLIGDFKYTYDFWSYEDHALNPQMPKYISTLAANGFEVHGGFLEQIRTRKITDPAKIAQPNKHLWQRTPYNPSRANLYNTLKQHVATSLQIERHRALDDKTREDESIPVLNKYGACQFCNFKSLCIAKLEGKKDLSVDIRVDYVHNTYAEGYNPTAPINEEF